MYITFTFLPFIPFFYSLPLVSIASAHPFIIVTRFKNRNIYCIVSHEIWVGKIIVSQIRSSSKEKKIWNFDRFPLVIDVNIGFNPHNHDLMHEISTVLINVEIVYIQATTFFVLTQLVDHTLFPWMNIFDIWLCQNVWACSKCWIVISPCKISWANHD